MHTPHDNTKPVNTATTLVVKQYECISDLSDQLLARAHAGKWDDAAALIQEYTLAVQALEALGAPHDTDYATCRTLIGRILQNDARLRELVEPERNRLNLEMGNLKRQTTVLTAYSAPVLTHER